MADWGLYAALRGTDNWAQRRADEQMEMQILEKHAAREERKTQQNMVAEEEINQYMDAMQSIDVLPEDQERIQEVERQARFNIIKGIASNNGDLARYVSSGGISDLHEYKNSITQSGEVKKALSNKENMAKIIADKQAGNRWFKPMEVDVPQVDENDNAIIDPKTGEQLLKKEMKTVDEQLALFKNGVIDNIQYNGSENKIKLNAMSFKGAFKDDKNKGGPNQVTTSDIVFQAMEAGASEEYANHLADTYIDRVNKGGDSWKWKALDPQEEALKQSIIDKNKAAAAKAKKGSSEKQKITNSALPRIQRLGKSGKPESAVMTANEKDAWNEQFGLVYDKTRGGYDPSAISKMGIDIESGAKYDLNNAISVNIGGDEKSYVSKVVDGKMQHFIVADVVYDANNHTNNNPHTESMGWDQLNDDGENRHNWTYERDAENLGITSVEEGTDVWHGQVLIPIDEEINSPAFRTNFNKRLNWTSNIDAYAASAINADYGGYAQNQVLNVMNTYGVDEKIAIEMLSGQK